MCALALVGGRAEDSDVPQMKDGLCETLQDFRVALLFFPHIVLIFLLPLFLILPLPFACTMNQKTNSISIVAIA